MGRAGSTGTGRGGDRSMRIGPPRPVAHGAGAGGPSGPPLPRCAPARRQDRGTTRLWFSPAVDRIGDNSADDWGLRALAVDNRGSAVDGRWGELGRFPSGVRMLTAMSWPCGPAEHRSALLGTRLRFFLDHSMTCGDAGFRGCADGWPGVVAGRCSGLRARAATRPGSPPYLRNYMSVIRPRLWRTLWITLAVRWTDGVSEPKRGMMHRLFTAPGAMPSRSGPIG